MLVSCQSQKLSILHCRLCSILKADRPSRQPANTLGKVIVHNSGWASESALKTGTFRQRQYVVVRAGDSEDPLPPWARKEEMQKLAGSQGSELPFWAWLLLSGVVSIAAVGSIYEFANKNSIFGYVPPSSPLWAPILGFFAITGIPTAGFMFIKAVKAANKSSALQDKIDGY